MSSEFHFISNDFEEFCPLSPGFEPMKHGYRLHKFTGCEFDRKHENMPVAQWEGMGVVGSAR